MAADYRDSESQMVTASEIRWTLDALPRSEDDCPIDLATLDHAELLAYAFSIQDDVRRLRETLHASTAQLHELTRQGKRQSHRIEQLVAELRLTCAETRELRARLRAIEGDR